MKKQIPDEEKIVDTKVNVKREGNELEVELIYEVIENIGTNEKILLWKDDETWQNEDYEY